MVDVVADDLLLECVVDAFAAAVDDCSSLGKSTTAS